jgi:MFS family permease
MPSSSPALSRRRVLLAKWGLPDLTGNGRFAGANLIDSLGNGLVMAFTIVYFTRTTSLPLTEIGAALTVGQLISLPVPAVIGPLVDRFGARAVVAAGNGISVLGFAGFLFSQQFWQIAVAQAVVQVGASCYWTASSQLAVLAARPGERTRWFGFIRALRNVGIGFGGAVSAIALSIGSTTGLRVVMLLNALTFAVAGWLILTWRPPADAGEPELDGQDTGPAERKGGYGTVLRDTAYLRMVGANLAFVFAAMVLTVLLAVYTADHLGVGTWIVGVLVVVNTALVALLQTVAGRWIEKRRPTRTIALAALVNIAAFAVFAALTVLPVWGIVAGLVIAILLYTAAEILSSPPLTELSVAMAPAHLRGRYLAVYQLSWTLGSALAPALLTSLLAGGAVLPWLFLAAVNLLAIPAVLGLEPRPKTESPSTSELESDLR